MLCELTFRFNYSLKSALTAIAFLSLALVIVHDRVVEPRPLYLHVYGTMVDASHDPDRPLSSPVSYDDRPWTRIATVTVFPGRSFGVQTPNDRRPAIAISGKLRQTWSGRYAGRLSWRLDDSNLTYDFDEPVDLDANTIVYIDQYYDAYLLSHTDDPYLALERAIQTDDPWTRKTR